MSVHFKLYIPPWFHHIPGQFVKAYLFSRQGRFIVRLKVFCPREKRHTQGLSRIRRSYRQKLLLLDIGFVRLTLGIKLHHIWYLHAQQNVSFYSKFNISFIASIFCLLIQQETFQVLVPFTGNLLWNVNILH